MFGIRRKQKTQPDVSINIEALKGQLARHEGLRKKPYRDTVGKLTIGIGRNLDDKGISKNEAFSLLENDIRDVLIDLHKLFPRWPKYPQNIKLVLADMRFNIGPSGFRSFRNMIDAVKRGDWRRMKREMIRSKWANQVGQRSENLAEMVQEVINDEVA